MQNIEKVNEVILIGKLCINKMKYGNQHNITILFDTEIDLRHKNDEDV